jgi:hypothetical protein
VGGNYFKCISCGQIKDEQYMHAGHYYSVGQYPGLRFDEDNCHGQCNHCNIFLHGNLIEYTYNLPLKIGTERFEKLRLRAGAYKRTGWKPYRFEIEEKIAEIRLKIKELDKT